jgi:hypothetical protein
MKTETWIVIVFAGMSALWIAAIALLSSVVASP